MFKFHLQSENEKPNISRRIKYKSYAEVAEPISAQPWSH